MTTTILSIAPRKAASALTRFTRETVGGPLSMQRFTTVCIDADAGLEIRVRAGCLWVPCRAEQCSVGVGPGERFVVRNADELLAYASERTELELVWPAIDVERAPLRLAA